MPKRRRATSEYTRDGKVRLRRTPAVGKELDRFVTAAAAAIAAAGKQGLTRHQLADAIDAGTKGADMTISRLREEKRIYVSTWRRGTPAYAAGNHPDAPRPTPAEPAYPRLDILAVAKQEVDAAHARWAATWVPHRDPAAEWIGGAA